MTSEEFEAGGWIERLARALSELSEAQEPFLQDHWRHNLRERVVVDGRDETPFPLDDLRMIYVLARHGGMCGEHGYYAPLRVAMDPVRGILRAHPVLWRVRGPTHRQRRFLGPDPRSWQPDVPDGPDRGLMRLAGRSAENVFYALPYYVSPSSCRMMCRTCYSIHGFWRWDA